MRNNKIFYVFRWVVFIQMALFGIASAEAQKWPMADTATTELMDREQCARNMKYIYSAIQSFRADHKETPSYLSDLVPRYVTDPNIFICPVARRTGQTEDSPLADPRMTCSYLYLFSPVPLTKAESTDSVTKTHREVSLKLVRTIGSIIPMVQCVHHSGILNLSYGGDVYLTTNVLEKPAPAPTPAVAHAQPPVTAPVTQPAVTEAAPIEPAPVVPVPTPVTVPTPTQAPAPAPAPVKVAEKPHVETPEPTQTPAPEVNKSVEKVMEKPVAKSTRQSPMIVPKRDPEATPAQIDLGNYYNAGLTQSWLGGSGDDLSQLPSGLQKFHGVTFDVRGIIQLAGSAESTRRFPTKVNAIPIHQKCERIHFLHAVAFGGTEDNTHQVATYVVHLATNQMQMEIPIHYGTDVRNWHMKADAKVKISKSAEAWIGSNPACELAGKAVRIFSTTWENVTPDIEVESIDFVSAQATPAPFLIAITAE